MKTAALSRLKHWIGLGEEPEQEARPVWLKRRRGRVTITRRQKAKQ